MAKSTNHTAHN